MRPKKIERTKEKSIIFRLDDRSYSLFKSYCSSHNIDMSSFLRTAIISFITQEGFINENNETNFNDKL